jgi:hypothetical protein
VKTIAFAFLTFALAAPSAAADPQQQPDQTHRYEKPKKPHLICRRDDTTGSRMARNICKTAEEWAGTTVESDQNKLGTVTRGQAGGSGVVATPE